MCACERHGDLGALCTCHCSHDLGGPTDVSAEGKPAGTAAGGPTAAPARRTSPETLAQLRALTIQRPCSTCGTRAGVTTCAAIGALNPDLSPVDYFHEARYGPVRDAWNASPRVRHIYRFPHAVTVTRAQLGLVPTDDTA